MLLCCVGPRRSRFVGKLPTRDETRRIRALDGALTAGVMITSHITKARGDKWPCRALLEAIVANLIFGALLAWRAL